MKCRRPADRRFEVTLPAGSEAEAIEPAAAIESAATDAAFAPQLDALDAQARRTVKAIAVLR